MTFAKCKKILSECLRNIFPQNWGIYNHGSQMAIAGFLESYVFGLRASGLWLRYAMLENLIPSFPWIAPPALHPGTIQGMEFCHLATLLSTAPKGF